MKINNIIGFAGSVILALLISIWMPVIGPFFSLIIPLPFIFYISKLGLREGLKIGFITLLIVGLLGILLGQPFLFLLCLEFGIIGLIISGLFKRQVHIGAAVFWGTAYTLFMGAIFLFLVGLSKGEGPVDMILGYFQSNLTRTVDIYKEMGLDKEKLDQIKQAVDLLSKVITRIYPAIIIIGTGIVIWINIVLSKPLFRKGSLPCPDLGETDRWHAPEFMVWGVIGAGFALFLQGTGIKFVAENVLSVLSVIYIFHGLSIMLFFFNKHGMPRWARLSIYAMIMVQLIFFVLLAMAGLFDQWVDFRRLHKKTDPEAA